MKKKTRFQFGHLRFLLERIWLVIIFSSRCGNNSIIRRWRLVQLLFVTNVSLENLCIDFYFVNFLVAKTLSRKKTLILDDLP